MKIETKFNIGDMVFCVETANRIITCDMCEGVGVIADMDLEEYECPKCNGMGTFFNGVKSKVIGPYKIIGVEVFKGKDLVDEKNRSEERYCTDNLDNYEEAPNIRSFEYNEKDIKIFKEKERAQHYCKNANRRRKIQ
jgi:hypothetical protein